MRERLPRGERDGRFFVYGFEGSHVTALLLPEGGGKMEEEEEEDEDEDEVRAWS